MGEHRSTGAGDAQYLTFSLAEEYYGIPILQVQEIRGFSPITAIPDTPRYVRGVMNLRGTVIPVLDLRARFALPEVEYGKLTVIMIVSVGGRAVGLIVDAVSDVLDVAAADVEPVPELVAGAETNALSGMVTSGERLVVLLDADRLVASTVSSMAA